MFTGGINTYMDKAFIDPDQMPYCMNMTMYQPPMMCTRASRESILSQQPDADKKIRDLWAYNDEMIFFLVEDGQSISHLHVVQKVNNGEYGLEKIFSDHDIPAGEKYFAIAEQQPRSTYIYVEKTTRQKSHLTLALQTHTGEQKITLLWMMGIMEFLRFTKEDYSLPTQIRTELHLVLFGISITS